jgi:hypothetical protein
MSSKESFCAACLAIPLALAGGAAAKGSYSAKKQRKRKLIFLIISIISFFISAGIAIYYLYIKKCDECLNSNIF